MNDKQARILDRLKAESTGRGTAYTDIADATIEMIGSTAYACWNTTRPGSVSNRLWCVSIGPRGKVTWHTRG